MMHNIIVSDPIVRNLTCQTCQKPFQSTIKRENGSPLPRYCSSPCRKPKVSVTCEECKKTYFVIPYRKEKSRWCSVACRRATEQSSPRYVYASKEWKESRQRALERDEYMCQNCGITKEDGTLEVNHIVPYRLLRSHILPNLITLCKPCHASMDWKVGDLLNMHPIRSRFLEILMEMWEVNLRKSNDYATSDDPLSNFKRANSIGISPFHGILIRIGDKMSRLEELSKKDSLVKGESIADTLTDLAVYSLLARIVYEEGLITPQK